MEREALALTALPDGTVGHSFLAFSVNCAKGRGFTVMVIPGGVAGETGITANFRKVQIMSDTLNLPAETRERAGKGASRVLRREGRVPAVIYGGKQEPVSIHVEEKELVRLLGTGTFFESTIELTLGGETIRTQPKDVAFHPVTDRPLHADFLRV